ncbi:MAG: hypothetical protein ACLTLQ_13825 [[Clostridium] scindens]
MAVGEEFHQDLAYDPHLGFLDVQPLQVVEVADDRRGMFVVKFIMPRRGRKARCIQIFFHFSCRALAEPGTFS